MIKHYEDLMFRKPIAAEPAHIERLGEAYRAADMVTWYGRIERQIADMLDAARDDNNEQSIDFLRTIHGKWVDHPIDANMNIEDLEALETAVAWPAKLEWQHKNYFSVLKDQLRRVIASTQELPTVPGGGGKEDRGGPTASASASATPPEELEAPNQQFGAEETPGEGEQPPEESEDDAEAQRIAAELAAATGA